ncbi:MAG: carboxypeptidase-like regulatory domain-containing protein [Bacteroidota bacterium]|nr:carboxypeptidase-like regulatory domain-containing protein [Bacteroidota bacterium]
MLNLSMSQSDLTRVLPLAWQNYLDNQPKLAGYKARYTPELATAAQARFEAALLLPDAQARNADPELTRMELLTQGREFLEVWQWLEGYIEGTYPGAAYKPMRDAAGYKSYAAAAGSDWSAMMALMNSAKQFVALHDAELQAKGDMPATFAARVVAEAADVETLLKRMAREAQAATDGTSARLTALRACLEEFMVVSRDAQRVFLRQPDVARLFQVEYLLSMVGGGAQAGVRGTLTLADGSPAAGVPVGIAGQADTVSDEDGRFALAVAAGNYTVVLGGNGGWVKQELPVAVEAGVKRRVDGVVGRVG